MQSRSAIDRALGAIKFCGDSSIKAAKKLKPEDGVDGQELWQLRQLAQELAAAVSVLVSEISK